MFIPKLGPLALLILACAALPLRAETIVALTTDGRLCHFNSAAPGGWTRIIDLTGIPAGQSPVAFDFLVDGSLFLFTREGSTLHLYNVNPNTGGATPKGFTINLPSAGSVAFDAFSPDVHNTDLVLVSDDDILRRFAFPGAFTTAGNRTLLYDNSVSDGDPVDEHTGANPVIVALASTNAFKGARAAVLYGIDATQNSLVKIDWETGSIDTVAALRTSAGADLAVQLRSGFDISGTTALAYTALGSGSENTSLFVVDLTSGIVNNAGPIGPTLHPPGVSVVDISVPPPTDVVNISTRARVGTGDDVMIAGFILQGGASNRLLIRGLGPSLTALGVSGALADPILTVKDANGAVIAINDNWKSTQQNEISQTGLQPGNEYDAAYLGVFSPGLYTAIVSGYADGTGVGLVEIYRLPDL
jgi:hypothetical protein